VAYVRTSTAIPDSIQYTCSNYWWTNLLYINNFYPKMESSMCLGWSWYLAVDMQFYIVTPVLLILFWKRPVFGWCASAILLIGSFSANIALVKTYSLSYNLLDTQTSEEYYDTIYTKPYARAPPYILGIMAAVYYLHLETRGSLQIPKWVLAIGYVVSAIAMLVTVYGTQSLYASFSGGPGWTEAEQILYISFSRFVFVGGVAFLMHACFCGYGGILKSLFESSIWTPLARLTYTAYLLHPVIIWVVYSNRTQIFHYDGFIHADEFLAHTVMAFAAAAVMFVLLEKPMMNLEMFLQGNKKH